MLEKPDLDESLILSRLEEAYGLRARKLSFLPLGADVNTAVYRVVTGGTVYFLKLRKGAFDEITVSVPHFLRSQGIEAIIDPLETITHQLWARLGDFTMILYPYVEGQNGYQVPLSDVQWMKFGATLRQIHTTLTGVQGTTLTGVQGTALTGVQGTTLTGVQGTALTGVQGTTLTRVQGTTALPPDLAGQVPCETFSPEWREMVKTFQTQVEENIYPDPTAAGMAALMRARRAEIRRLVMRTETLAHALQGRPLTQGTPEGQDRVLCHTDIHPGNLLLGANDALYIVDWDNPVLAPKERDLMLIGGCPTWNGARETALFYDNYGPAEIDPTALAYYRYERIIQDIAAYGQQLLLSGTQCASPQGCASGGEDREQSFTYFASNFLPGGEIEIAFQRDRATL